jgi:hypothetical protein
MLPEEQARPTAATSTSWRRASSAGRSTRSRRPGVPLQVRPGRQDRHRRPPARHKVTARSPRCAASTRAGRDLAADVPRLDDRRRLPPLADEVREATGGIPIGFKLSAQHIEPTSTPRSRSASTTSSSTAAAAAPAPRRCMFRDNISVPTIPALARARRHLDRRRRRDVTLVITGGLRTAGRLRQGAGARRRRRRDLQRGDAGDRLPRHAGLPHRQLPGRHRHPEAGPAGAAGRRRVGAAPRTVLRAAVELMQVLARACGHDRSTSSTATSTT